MASILDHPEAQERLSEATLDPESLRSCRRRLSRFIERYLPHFYRVEQREHARTILEGKLLHLPRKTTEPIAIQAGLKRRPLQLFLGAGQWSDEALREELAVHLRQAIGQPDGVLILDPSGFPKKGEHSCGVGRQWCGRLGKTDNCQVGVFLAYSSGKGKALVDARLYLQKERANDAEHRKQTHIPDEVTFQEKWRLGLDLLAKSSGRLPHGWVCADDEFGRVAEFRASLRAAREHYVLDVPCNTLIRDWSAESAGPEAIPEWERVDEWAKSQPEDRWRRVRVKDGTKGPLWVWVLEAAVETTGGEGADSAMERLAVIRSEGEETRIWYTLCDQGFDVGTEVVVRVHAARHGIEELFEEGNEEVGLDQYEVRSWLGWAHHMTLSMLALWFLQLQKARLGKKLR